MRNITNTYNDDGNGNGLLLTNNQHMIGPKLLYKYILLVSYPTLYFLELIIKCKTYQQQIILEMPLQDRKRIRMNAGPQSSVCFIAFFSSLFASQLILL